jgi:hypothetical protein
MSVAWLRSSPADVRRLAPEGALRQVSRPRCPSGHSPENCNSERGRPSPPSRSDAPLGITRFARFLVAWVDDEIRGVGCAESACRSAVDRLDRVPAYVPWGHHIGMTRASLPDRGVRTPGRCPDGHRPGDPTPRTAVRPHRHFAPGIPPRTCDPPCRPHRPGDPTPGPRFGHVRDASRPHRPGKPTPGVDATAPPPKDHQPSTWRIVSPPKASGSPTWNASAASFHAWKRGSWSWR